LVFGGPDVVVVVAGGENWKAFWCDLKRFFGVANTTLLGNA
jgi:hypothetical protein